MGCLMLFKWHMFQDQHHLLILEQKSTNLLNRLVKLKLDCAIELVT